jgi:hypothetical protein
MFLGSWEHRLAEIATKHKAEENEQRAGNSAGRQNQNQKKGRRTRPPDRKGRTPYLRFMLFLCDLILKTLSHTPRESD